MHLNKKHISEWTDDEVVHAAVVNTNPYGATVEMMRRLKEAVNENGATTNSLTKWILRLTWAIAFFTVAMAFLVIFQIILATNVIPL